MSDTFRITGFWLRHDPAKDRKHMNRDFAGAIGYDNSTFSVIEDGGGCSSGIYFAKNRMIELTYMQDSHPYSIAVDSLKKV